MDKSDYQLYAIYKSIEDARERKKYAREIGLRSQGRGVSSWLTRVERDIAVGLLEKYIAIDVFDNTERCQFCGAPGGHVQGCTVLITDKFLRGLS